MRVIGPVKPRWAEVVGLIALAVLVGISSLQEPGLGDDIGYWRLGLNLVEEGRAAWGTGFHDLRWPVWGVCWLLNLVFGPGPISYYGEPLFYFAAGSVLVLILGYVAFRDRTAAWLAALVFLFHPLLDPAIIRPMPDLSEGFWCAATVAAWLGLIRSESFRNRALFAAAAGLCLAVGYANRITGLFTIPVLVVGTLIFRPRQWYWLAAIGATAAFFVLIECLVYYSLTGDFLHSLHANLSARGRKGTEFVPLWWLPLRFFDSLWNGNFLKVPVNLFAVWGAVTIFRRGRLETRAILLWTVAYYIAFSCAPQSLNPLRPIVRDGERFLASLAFPMSFLAAEGMLAMCAAAGRAGWWAKLRWMPALASRPWLALSVLAVGLTVVSSRDWFDLGFLPRMSRLLDSIPAGSRIYTHDGMREIAMLANARASRKLSWLKADRFLFTEGDDVQLAASADWMCYNRKIMWVSTRKKLERGEIDRMPPLGEYLDNPDASWAPVDVFNRSEYPDFVFYRKRAAADPPPQLVQSSDDAARVLTGMGPCPWEWDRGEMSSLWMTEPRAIPASWSGALVRLRIDGSGNLPEAVRLLTVRFFDGTRRLEQILLNPYMFPGGGTDFFVFRVPAGADSCVIKGSVSKSARKIRIDQARAWVYPARTPFP